MLPRIGSSWSFPPRCAGAFRSWPTPRAVPLCRLPTAPHLSTLRESLANAPEAADAAAASSASPTATFLRVPEVKPPGPGPYYKRNRMLRTAFQQRSPELQRRVQKKRGSPYVPNLRQYPTSKDSRESAVVCARAARRQVGFDTIAEHFRYRVPQWDETLGLLRGMTAETGDRHAMAAIRVKLPGAWNLDVTGRKVDFIDSTTGLAAKLRLSADARKRSAFILRGQRAVLESAGDYLIKKKGAEIFQLEDMTSSDYEAQQLWPVINDAPDGGLSVPGGSPDAIWVHEELDLEARWIESPYEETPVPEAWTMESFETYVETIVRDRLRPELAMKYYGKKVDTDGIRIRLLLKAFESSSAASHITPHAFKIALAFMTQRNMASAEQLLTAAEETSVPLDMGSFNIVLRGYMLTRDVTSFHRALDRMKARYLFPNARTWLLFLELAKKEGVRKQIVAVMYEMGLFEDRATRRGIARIMACHDAYSAFKTGVTLEHFMSQQATRYGPNWHSPGVTSSILTEFFKFHNPSHERFDDFKSLIEGSADRPHAGIRDINAVLNAASKHIHWPTALWALGRVGHGRGELEPDDATYLNVMRLAIKAHSPYALAIVIFYGVVYRKLRYDARVELFKLLMKKHWDEWWREDRPLTFLSREARQALEKNPARGPSSVVASMARAILSTVGSYRPSRPLAAMLDMALRSRDGPMHARLKRLAAGEAAGRWPDDMITVVKMQDPRAEQPKKYVRLNQYFAPGRMIASQREGEPPGGDGEAGPVPGKGQVRSRAGDETGRKEKEDLQTSQREGAWTTVDRARLAE